MTAELRMNPLLRHTFLSLAVASLAACSSGDNNTSTPVDDTPAVDTDAPADADTGGSTDTPTDAGDNGSPSDDGGDNTPDYGDLPAPTIPAVDLLAAPIPGPTLDDPFGSLLEIDSETPTAGGAPTQPKNLRIDLVSNDWAEFSWAPANDDGEVVAYNIYRSDGHVYTVGRDQTDDNALAQVEIDKFWSTTSFIDCNYTRFATRLHERASFGPKAGDIFSYEVTAVDDNGQESIPSDPITINYHADRGAAVPLYADPYLDESRFAQKHDLSNTAYFMDKFSLVFEDDFNGDSIDSARWNTQLVWGDETIINGEQQYFVNTQNEPDFGYNPFKISDSILTIEATPVPDELQGQLPDICTGTDASGKERCLFLSGALSSHDKFNMTYGYVEGRMKTSGAYGALSSFYLYHRYPGNGINLHAPEIDIIEYLGENPFGDEDAFQTYHFADVNTGETRSAPTMSYKNPTGELFSDEFHTYGVLWEPQLVIWYIDGVEIKRLSGPQVSRQGMNIVTYLVAGSGWAPTPDAENDTFPLRYEIDYIRAWQRDAYDSNGLYPQ